MRHCAGALFKAWAFWTRCMSSAKSRSTNRMCSIVAKVLASWRVIALWRTRVNIAIGTSLTCGYSWPLDDTSGDIKSKVSTLAASVVSIIIPHPLSWPNVAIIRRAINHQQLLFPSLSSNACFDSRAFSSPLKQTVKSLFQKAHSVCLLSDFFRSWNRFVMRVANRRSKSKLSLLDGGISEVIAGACVSVGRSHPLLLGYCALKVRKAHAVLERWFLC